MAVLKSRLGLLLLMQIVLVNLSLSSSSSLPLKEQGVIPYSVEDVESESRAFTLFEAWKFKHGKEYSHEEKMKRFGIFRENLRRIHRHNSRGTSSFTLGLTRFADLTNDEFKKLNYFGARPRPEVLSHRINSSRSNLKLQTCDTSDLDESFDWRDEDAVVSVKDQGSCGMSSFLFIPH